MGRKVAAFQNAKLEEPVDPALRYLRGSRKQCAPPPGGFDPWRKSAAACLFSGEAMEIKEIMMRSVETIEPDESVCEAARKMASQNIGFLHVWQDGELVGVLTDRDIVVR